MGTDDSISGGVAVTLSEREDGLEAIVHDLARPPYGVQVQTPSPLRLNEFARSQGPDLLEKCQRFHSYVDEVRATGVYDAMYRVELQGPLDHRILARDASTGETRELVCFDSNSYLGLHLHPRVRAAAHRAIDEAGAGTPSAQVLGGHNRWLRALEERVAALLGREECLIYPSGYQANIGILTGLLRSGDRAIADRFAHASLHDGCAYSGATALTFAHGDLESLDLQLAAGSPGALVVTDGLFSMHGDLCDLPGLRATADKHGARLMIDDAHSVGILGATGGGIEEHYGMHGAADVLMGTFSKAPGAAGGYVVGDRSLIDYLRFFSHGALFTASLPAPTCAAITEAFAVMQDEPEHRERLWANTRRMWQGLVDVGLRVPPFSSPILTVRVGDESLLGPMAVALFQRGVKAGMAQHPAVPHGQSILRITVNARHTPDDLERSLEVLGRLGRQFGIVEAH
jgi:7-keto-8-aminopelargonate synthetase-like enzyme